MNAMATHIRTFVDMHTGVVHISTAKTLTTESRLGSYRFVGAKPWVSVLPGAAGAMVGLLVPLLGCEDCFWPFFCK